MLCPGKLLFLDKEGVDNYGFNKFVFIASHGGNMKITEEIINEIAT